ncbi:MULTISPECIES: hypothetical protein [Streptomyces]|uniref:Uncharacterized protein n=1 Tax=Streptomyces nymphaeiformis TaxID=2663842 RepID=A0A7W7U1F5_9ACTN|nr:hypothetical protein [Streptomyces nymphaeiformis]MBB4983229.1 hypothetical protein [Streptomyces nymphaeiformis]
MRRRREKKRRPPFPLPQALLLLSTPDVRRHSLIDVQGGMTCRGDRSWTAQVRVLGDAE